MKTKIEYHTQGVDHGRYHVIKEGRRVSGFTPGYWHPFPEEAPEPFRLLYIIDGKGERQGHLSTKIIWDGERFATDLAHVLLVDPNDIVGWRYLDEDRNEGGN